ncbi:hypothetical protein CYY_005645 [Polysphondylium violaceum]|uniref:Rab GTPase n=1 Tax=Polysphondylium violaceum TaxID=133409 RepID=A0A8J4PVZ7_9MYCE|nr:hypothetical protein CYY_005645 [Polysphondylium violaceum]
MDSTSSFESKVVLLGSSDVGKTAISLRYAEGIFNKRPTPTIGASFLTKTINLEGNKIKFLIWDTAGQDRFRSLTPMYYRGACVAILVFDMCLQKTFDTVKEWVEELKANIQEEIVMVVCGNKMDLQHKRQVKRETAKQFADEIKAMYFETSAKDNENIEPMFLEIAKKLIIDKHTKYMQEIQKQQQLHKQYQTQNQSLYRQQIQQQQLQQQRNINSTYENDNNQCCS